MNSLQGKKSQGKKRRAKLNAVLCCSIAVWLCATLTSGAQSQQAPGQLPQQGLPRLKKQPPLFFRSTKSSNTTDGGGALGEQGIKHLDLTNAVAQVATVSLRYGQLTVSANNSDLTQILKSLANISGMKIEGMKSGPRIFGVYGPGNVREVLSALLVGTGYNFIMVGGANGSIPHDLVLTVQNDTPSTMTSHDPRATISSGGEGIPLHSEALLRNEVEISSTEAPGPGAISAAPSHNDQDDSTRMQQTLLHLQHMQEPLQDATQ